MSTKSRRRELERINCDPNIELLPIGPLTHLRIQHLVHPHRVHLILHHRHHLPHHRHLLHHLKHQRRGQPMGVKVLLQSHPRHLHLKHQRRGQPMRVKVLLQSHPRIPPMEGHLQVRTHPAVLPSGPPVDPILQVRAHPAVLLSGPPIDPIIPIILFLRIQVETRKSLLLI